MSTACHSLTWSDLEHWNTIMYGGQTVYVTPKRDQKPLGCETSHSEHPLGFLAQIGVAPKKEERGCLGKHTLAQNLSKTLQIPRII